MPQTHVVFYQEDDGTVPVLTVSMTKPGRSPWCIERLKGLGHQLRRPEADYLRDGVYELRVGLQGIHHRILYFFHGHAVAVLSHGLVKERAIPPKEIELARRRKNRFEADPEGHTYGEE